MAKSKDKDQKGKGRKNLIRRVKKAVKKSKRHLDEERFKREVERTIAFLQEIRAKIDTSSVKRTRAKRRLAIARNLAHASPSGRRKLKK